MKHNIPSVRAIREPREWKGIPGYDAYEISDTGLLRSNKKRESKILNGSATPPGYIQYKLIGEEKGDFRYVYAQELVLELWDKERPQGMWANHVDDDPGNNAIENLKWSSPKVTNATRNLPLGEDKYFAKLTEQDVRDIRRKRKEGATYPALAEEYGMARDVLWRACMGKTWKHVLSE